MEQDPNSDKITVIVSTALRDWRSPDGLPYVELQMLVKAHPSVPPQHLPWVRMSIDSATQLLDLLQTAIAGAQGVFESPAGPPN